MHVTMLHVNTGTIGLWYIELTKAQFHFEVGVYGQVEYMEIKIHEAHFNYEFGNVKLFISDLLMLVLDIQMLVPLFSLIQV